MEKLLMYRETKNLYKILNESILKNPITRNWESSIVYQEYLVMMNGKYIPSKEKKVFVRLVSELPEKFDYVNLESEATIYYGMSGALKTTTISAKNRGTVLLTNLKSWKSYENGIFKDKIPNSNLNYSILMLLNLEKFVTENRGLHLDIERGLTDTLFFENIKYPEKCDSELIQSSVKKELELLENYKVKKVLLVQKDRSFIERVVLKESTRNEWFKDVDSYLEAQENYIEFTKKHNEISEIVEISDAIYYITSDLGLEEKKDKTRI